MAHRETIQNKKLKAAMPTTNHVYTVSAHVGYGYPNKTEDVRLVQFFINASIDIWGKDWRGRPKKLETDGIFGGKTWGAIKSYQEHALSAVVDGMVSPVDGARLETPNNRKIYTMYLLNWHYWMDRYQHFDDIRTDPTCPGELREYLGGPLPNLL